MVEITINRHTNNNRIFKYCVCGHAEDLICNSVSVLTQTPVMGLKWLGYKPYTLRVKDKGFFEVWTESESDERAQVLLETMLLGLQSLERQYPDEVVIKTQMSVSVW